MANCIKKYNCPECNKEHKVDFDFYDPEDQDEEEVSVECDCGCEFDVSCIIHVDYDFRAKHPILRVSNKDKEQKPEFDLNDTSTWPKENNPNQLTIL
jgi:hypothetical protein